MRITKGKDIALPSGARWLLLSMGRTSATLTLGDVLMVQSWR
jgi:hypothetical protein